MAEGSFFGIDRPFVEEEEDPLVLIFEFADFLTDRELREKAQIISGYIENEVQMNVDNLRIDSGISNFVVIETASTNIDIQSVEDIRDRVFGMSDYKNMIISTVPPDEISRLARRR